MGNSARQRALQDFKMSEVSSALLDYYGTVLKADRDLNMATVTSTWPHLMLKSSRR